MSNHVDIEREGVAETLLLTLYNRAVESRRPNPILRDEQAGRWIEQIDYDFSQFGDGRITHPIQAKVFDDWARDFLTRHPDAPIVNLGAGLSTMHTRVDNGTVRFVDLDLPEAIAVRRRFVEETARHRMIAVSALDPTWMEALDPERPVFFVAGGVLMYFEPDDVRFLLRTLVSQFPGEEMAFDVIPTWFSRRSLNGKVQGANFPLPPVPWALDDPRVPELETWHPYIEGGEQRDYTQGFRERWRLIGWLARVPRGTDSVMHTQS